MQHIWSRMLAFYILMLVLGVGAMVLQGNWELLLPDSWSHWVSGAAIGLGIGLAVVGASRWAHGKWEWATQLTNEFRNLLGDVTPRQALIVAILSGLGEEVLFRGVLQPALGLWIAAAVFGLLHIGPNPRFLPWTAMAFAAGLGFGALVLWQGSLVPAIVAHVTINYLNLRFLGEGRAELHIVQLGPVPVQSFGPMEPEAKVVPLRRELG